MFNVWRANTIVFAFQLALGSAFYAETHSVWGSSAVVVVVTFMVLNGLTGNDVTDDDLPSALLSAFFAAWAPLFWTLGWQYGIFMSLGVATVTSYYVATVGERYRSEPWPLVFLAALPFGVGTMLGGAVLLYRLLYETGNEPIT